MPKEGTTKTRCRTHHQVVTIPLASSGRRGSSGSALKEWCEDSFESPRQAGRELAVKLLLKHGTIGGYSQADEKTDNEVDIEGDDSRAGNGSEFEWASAEDVEHT